MAPGSDLRFRVMFAPDDRPPTRLRLRIIPTMIGVLAVLNVASVVLALIE
jgi:hypothetical protein